MIPFRFSSIGTFAREMIPAFRRNAGQVSANTVEPVALSSRDETVDEAYQSVLAAARACQGSGPHYTYEALRQLQQAGRNFADTFQAPGSQQATTGDLAAALVEARARLPVQPGSSRAVLKPLLREIQTQLLPYLNTAPAVAKVSNHFPALHAAVTAYMEALGSQRLHPGRGIAERFSGSRPKARTHEDIHEQTLRSLRPNLFQHTNRQALFSYTRPPREDGDVLPAYSGRPGRSVLPVDLNIRIERLIRKLHKPIGEARGHSNPSVLLEELKSLLGSADISATERGEMLYRLARNIPDESKMGGTQTGKLARLFLRFLAPNHLSQKYHQVPAAFSAGIGTERFNSETLVPPAAMEYIVMALIRQINRFGSDGTIVCDILKGVLMNKRETGLVAHAQLLREAAIEIDARQGAIANGRLLRTLVSVIVDEIAWLEKSVAPMSLSFLPVEDVMQSLHTEVPIRYNLRGLSIPSAPGWNGVLRELPAYSRLMRHLALLPAAEAFIPVDSDPAVPDRSERG